MIVFATALRSSVLLLPIAGYLLVLALPLPKALSAAVRYDYNLGLLVIAGLLWLTWRLRGRAGAALGLGAVLFLFALPLNGLWTNASSEMHVLGGLVYFSDTAGFYWDANRLLDGGLLSAFSARRPIFAGFLAFLLGLTNHNLQLTLALLVALSAAACWLAARELRETYGPAAASLFILLLFLFYRRFIGMTDTENLGFALGAVGFALLLRGGRFGQWIFILPGVLLITLALNVRAGPFLVLPALILWAARFHSFGGARDRMASLTAVVAVSAVIAFGFLLNMLVFKITSNGQGQPFSNYAYTIYGMAFGGQGWMQVFQDHPEFYDMPEAQAAQRIYGLAWQAVKQQPGRFAQVVINQFGTFLSLSDKSIFGFASGGDLVIYDAPRPALLGWYRVARLFLYALSLVGLFGSVRRRSPVDTLLLYMLLGITASVAFIPPRDASLMRVYAATIPAIAAIPAAGLAKFGNLFRRKAAPAAFPPTEASSLHLGEAGVGLLIFGIGLAALIISGPLAVRWFSRPPFALPGQSECLAGEQSVTVRISPGSFIRVVADDVQPGAHVPDLHYSDYKNSLRSFPHYADIAGLEDLTVPALLLDAVDLRTGQGFWLVLKTVQNPKQTTILNLCGTWSSSFPDLGGGLFYGVIPEG